jgi:hypothetical protein
MDRMYAVTLIPTYARYYVCCQYYLQSKNILLRVTGIHNNIQESIWTLEKVHE